MIRHVLFDLDGTLCHSAPGITRSLAHAMLVAGAVPAELDELQRYIGDPLPEILRALLPDAGDDLVDLAVKAYVDRFAHIGIRENSLFPGIPEMLEVLTGNGSRIYVTTVKEQSVAERVVGCLGLTRFLHEVYGACPEQGVTSKTDVVRRAITDHEIDVADAALVGDRHHDIEAAQTLGLRAVGVSWGYGAAAELATADNIARSPGALPEILGFAA